MPALLLASFLLAGAVAGGVGYDQIAWSPPQIIFGAPQSPASVPLDNWARTFRLGELAWSLSDGKMGDLAAADFVDRPHGVSNVFAERWPQALP